VFKTWLEGRSNRMAAKLENRTEDECRSILDEDMRELGLALGQQREAIEIGDEQLEGIDKWLEGPEEESDQLPVTSDEESGDE